MPGNGGVSTTSQQATSSSLPHTKRASLCSMPPAASAPLHRRPSLPLYNNNKDKKDDSGKPLQHIEFQRNNAAKLSEDKMVVVCSASESSNTSLPSTGSSWVSESQEWGIGRPRTPVDEQRMSVPDSTTSQLEGKQTYTSGDDVFVKQKDGRYYLGTVIRSSPGGERWLVRFGDETERWAGGCELRPLGRVGGDEGEGSVLCVVCKVRGSGGEVVACDHCGRGYHRHCHGHTHDTQGGVWQCKRCVEQRYKVAALESRARKKEMLNTQRQLQKPPDILPYNINSLQWDAQHRENSEGVYCYCGNTGHWYKKMLQCVRCRQWFHHKCVSCLRHPLYTGDRFYVFACSLCNHGSEFLRRVELQWVDLVHLMLFNLTCFNLKKYYDLDTVIMPYIMDNWYALQLPEKMQSVTPSQRREQIVLALTGNRNRFKCGRETKKRASIWGLRGREPPHPPPPLTPLPTRGPLTEQVLHNKVPFIPEHDSPSSSLDPAREKRMIVPIDSHWVSVMTGRRFQDNSISSDNDSMRSTPSPVEDIMCRSRLNPDSSDIFNNRNRDDSPYSFDSKSGDEKLMTPVAKRKELKLYEMNYEGCGFVKKSVPFPKSTLNKRKSFLDSLRQGCKSKETVKKETVTELPAIKSDDGYKSTKLLRTRLAKQQKSMMVNSGKTLMSIGTNTPPVADETVFTFLHARSNSHKNSKDKEHYSEYDATKREVVLPPTPPMSVSAPPTPPVMSGGPPSSSCSSNDAPPDFQIKETNNYDSDQDKSVKSSNSSSSDNIKISLLQKTPPKNKIKDTLSTPKKDKSPSALLNGSLANGHNSKIAAINLEISKLSTKNIIEHSKIMSLHHMNDPYSIFKVEQDSSGDDTSSRGTLDSIIPPPANFQGKNNPFHWQSNMNHKNSLANKLFNRHSLSKLQTANVNGSSKSRISLPVNLNPVIVPPMRPLKRHLSEKDLVIGPNGEVKRRRLRRPRKSLQNQLNQNAKDHSMNERQKSLRSSYGNEEGTNRSCGDQQQQNAIKSSNSLEELQQLNTCMEYTQNGRILRQRQEKNYCDSRRGSTSSNNMLTSTPPNSTLNLSNSNNANSSSGVRSLNLSPQKMSPFKNDSFNKTNSAENSSAINELKNSVHSYFGALNRIVAGEKFTLVGRRLMENGSVQYLIEWDGHGS